VELAANFSLKPQRVTEVQKLIEEHVHEIRGACVKHFPSGSHNVSPHGFWLFVAERELFVPFSDFPWFRDVSVREITNVHLPSPHHLYWPDLDIDLAVETIEHPDRYPLISQAQPPKRVQPMKARRRRAKTRARTPHLRGTES
jgi:hypothetical protein